MKTVILYVLTIPFALLLATYLAGYISGAKWKKEQLDNLEKAKEQMADSQKKVLASHLRVMEAVNTYKRVSSASMEALVARGTKH